MNDSTPLVAWHIPAGPHEITPAWLTAALRSTGTLHHATVCTMAVDDIGAIAGHSGALVRLQLTYDTDEASAPGTLIAKFPAPDPHVRVALSRQGSYANEIRFYEDLAARLALRTPKRYYSAQDTTGHAYVLLLEDLAPARVGNDVAGCSAAGATQVVCALTGLHTSLIGCGPLGILDLLSEWVGPAGRVVGLEREPHLIAMAKSVLAERHLTNVHLVEADATTTGLPREAFDFVHERLVLLQQPHPERTLTEMVALVRPGGIVAVQDIDHASWFCEPPHPAWTTLLGVFHTVCRAHGVDLFIGRRLPGLLRAAGLVDVEVEVHIRVDPPGAYRRKQLLALITLVQDTVVAQGLLSARELTGLLESLERHLDDPQTVVPRELLFQAWGYKPGR